MSENTKETIKFLMGILCLVCGIVLSFTALFLPPQGVIDSSVLILIGEVLTFVGAIWHLGDYTRVQLKKIESETKEFLENKKETK